MCASCATMAGHPETRPARASGPPAAAAPAPSPRDAILLNGTAVLLFLWIAARAAIQSITIDEADTYLTYVARPSPSHWEAAANNHVLNSLLMRLSTAVFGVSALSARIPALLGAALYIGAALVLARLIAADRTLRWFLLIALTANPFVMDHLVAARGYSLALAFLLFAIAAAASYVWQRPDSSPRSLYRRCAICSIACGLSFSANFSFAFADASTLLLLSVWLAAQAGPSRGRKPATYAKVLLASTVPGALVALFFTGSILLAWQRSALVWGARSMKECLHSVTQATLFQPNPYLLNPLLHCALAACQPFLFPALGIACAFRLVTLAAGARQLRARCSRFQLALCGIGGGAAILSMACHYLLFRTQHILLPLDRTAVFLAPLGALFAGSLAAIPQESASGAVSRRLSRAALAIFGIYFLCCLRLTYFRTWDFDAGMNHAYAALAFYSRNYGVTEVSSNWRYVAALNFYRAASPSTLAEIPGGPTTVGEYPPGKDAYVLYRPSDQGFIERRHLKVVYYDFETGVAVAVPPTLDITSYHGYVH